MYSETDTSITQTTDSYKLSVFFTPKRVANRFVCAGIIGMALFAGTEAQAASYTLSAGNSAVWLETTPGVLTSAAVNQANVDAALSGGGNVELGRLGSNPATTLTGTFGSETVTLSSLLFSDWAANGNALAASYITDAATSIGATLNATQLGLAIAQFLSTSAWQLVSDPNISDFNLINGQVVVGMDGYLDATPVLNALFPGLPVPANAQASEVVKVSHAGNTQYLYGFQATATGYVSNNLANSFTGRYEVRTVPEPETLALIGLGLLAAFSVRKLRTV